MKYLSAICTDVGTKKSTNQDSVCLKAAETSIGTVIMAVMCDGMGGLAKGEVASAGVIKTFSDWFENDLPSQLMNFKIDDIEYQWDRMVKEQNVKIAEYGSNLNINLGTTLTAVLIIDYNVIIIGHVGDSRAYQIKNDAVVLTEDQTLVAREVKNGKMTAEQAAVDPRRNVLLQCIGASKVVVPDFYEIKVEPESVIMLCTDGFRHLVSKEEIYNAFCPQNLLTEEDMEIAAKRLVEANKNRGETDNISVLLIKIL